MTAALTWARLSYRQQRWELWLVVAGVALTVAGMIWFAIQIEGLRAANPECLPSVVDQGLVDEGPTAACQADLTAYYETTGFANIFLYLSFGAPFGMGVLLGAPLVAREIDAGTAQLAWSIGRSRTWWLLRRIAFVTLFAVLLLGVLAVTSEILAAALAPDRDLSRDFTWFGRRGWLIVVRGIGALMIGMVVGALIGRVLPAILAAALVVALAFTAVSIGMDRWREAEAVVQRFTTDTGEPVAYEPGSLDVSFGLQTPDGAVYTWSEAQERGLVAQVIDEQGRNFASEEDMRAGRVLGWDVRLWIPGTRYPEFVVREAAAAAGLGVLALGLAAIVVRSRRPV